MSKVQDAIRAASRRKVPGAITKGETQESSRLLDRKSAAPAALGDFAQVGLDARQMERSCILPYVRDKGATNAYKLLRTRLLQRAREHQWRTLMVTGTSPGEGKTTTAINLSIGASQDVRQAVLLVDMDLQRPAIATSLGIQRRAGLSDYLRGDAEWQDVIYNTDLSRFAVLPNFEAYESPESSISPKMLELLDRMKKLDPNLLIVFDMPPILSSDDVLAFGPHVDALLLVIAEGRTNRALLERASEMIEQIPRIGTVLNRSSEFNAGYY